MWKPLIILVNACSLPSPPAQYSYISSHPECQNEAHRHRVHPLKRIKNNVQIRHIDGIEFTIFTAKILEFSTALPGSTPDQMAEPRHN
jgi:hypothetical protein